MRPRFIAFFVCTFLLASCGDSGTKLSSDILPQQSISLAPKESTLCTPVSKVRFDDASTISTEEGTFTLIGVTPLDVPEDKATQAENFFTVLAENIYCIGNDPKVDHKDLVYIYDKDITLLTTEILRAGYGSTYGDGEYIYKSYFKGLEEEAIESKRGLYAEEGTDVEAQSSYVLPESIPYAVGGIVTTRFIINSVGSSNEYVYYNSEKDYADEDNIAIKVSIDDQFLSYSSNPDQFIGDTIEVRGEVTNEDGNLFIEVKSIEDMKVL